jgi:RNA polymerase sigma-70 factor (ECF subfamily)
LGLFLGPLFTAFRVLRVEVVTAPASQPQLAREFVRWLAAARSGSAEAIGQLLESCRQYLLLLANEELPSDLRPKVAASDLVQDTFLKAHEHFAQFRGGAPDELLAWLRRILLNDLANSNRHYFQTGKRQMSREVPLANAPPANLQNALASEADSPRAQLLALEKADALDRALEQLPENYRDAILWRTHDGLPFEEIGRRLDRSERAARKLWVRAIERLQDLLEVGDDSS